MKNYSFLPVAIRCNNPLNITHVKNGVCNNLAVATYHSSVMSQRFLVFRSFEDGFIAALVLLHTHYFGLTIKQVIEKWCPDSTSSSYINSVNDFIRTLVPSYMYDFIDKFRIGHRFQGTNSIIYDRLLPALLLSMAYVECGRIYSDVLPDFALVESYVEKYNFLIKK